MDLYIPFLASLMLLLASKQLWVPAGRRDDHARATGVEVCERAP